jgi:hypothetical protein
LFLATGVAAALWLFLTGAASAAPSTSPPFNECPAIGLASSCSVLFLINPDGSVTTLTDGSVGPFEGDEDSLVGVFNNSAGTLNSLTLTGSGIFGFDSDGLCSGTIIAPPGTYTPPAGCPFGSTGYEGPNTSFSIVDADNGTVNFLPSGLAPGETAYFSLEGPPSELNISLEQPIITKPVAITATEGASFSGEVATATDADPASTGSEYSCTIDWGDGTTLDSTTCSVSGSGGAFTVDGTHTYADEGTYSATVTLTDIDTTTNTSSAVSTATVSDAALTAGTLTATGGVEGVTAGTASVTFTDANPLATTADFTSGGGSVSCDWGDGTTTSGTATGPVSGTFTADCTGGHIYAEEGTYTVTITVTDDGGSTIAPSTSVTTADAPLHSTCTGVASVSPQAFSGKTANFTDDDPNGTATDYTISIDWGDGHTTAGTVGGSAPFTANGSHTYTSTGHFTIKTTITDHSESTTATCSTLIFAFAPGRGAFVIGNGNSANTTAVNFWGPQWSKNNTLGGGAAPSAFKGYALNPATPACGVGWSTDPGNSAPPPAGPLPAFMGVIVTSSASQSGSQISGNTPHIVVVQTDPGYAPAVGHAGTGTVVAQFC